MDIYEAKEVVEKLIVEHKLGLIFSKDETPNHFFYENDEVTISIGSPIDTYVCIDWEQDDINYNLYAHRATKEKIAKLFEAYRHIKGE